MSILLTDKSRNFIESKDIKELIIDVKLLEEPCTQIFDSKISILKTSNDENLNSYEKVSENGITLHISQKFIEIFGHLKKFQLNVGGFLKKELYLENIDPIIKDICKK